MCVYKVSGCDALRRKIDYVECKHSLSPHLADAPLSYIIGKRCQARNKLDKPDGHVIMIQCTRIHCSCVIGRIREKKIKHRNEHNFVSG